MQLDLLTYTLTPEEATLPAQPAVQPPSPAMLWHQGCADFYLRLMNRFMAGGRCSSEVRRHEITRLHRLREQALAKVKQLGDS